MAKLTWDDTSKRLYETGVKQGVLYVADSKGTYPKGVAWNGLSSVSESPSGADANDIYADDSKYLTLRATEEFGGTIEAYTYPDEFGVCDGTVEVTPGVVIGQQARKPFGLCYRTTLGNDTELDSYGYKLHLVYNATASPSERQYQTVNDSPEAISFSWEFSTTPISAGSEYRKTSLITIDSTKVDAAKLAILEAKLYGSENETATLPLPEEVFALLKGE